MAKFMVIIKGGDPQSRKLSPEEMQEHMSKWGAWMQGLTEQGVLLGGEPLESGGNFITGPDKVVTDGPWPEIKDVVGGYLLFETDNLDSATEIAKGCPVFDDADKLNNTNQASLEVRAIMKMEM